MTISAIVGLGNPGDEHARDRHNVGFWFLDEIIRADAAAGFRSEQKMLGDVCTFHVGSHRVRLLKPTTYMNKSGESVRRFLDFFKLDISDVLVVHDELDLPPGVMRFKQGGGHGGHNGLRDIIKHCGADFLRLRVGIGHPGHKSAVTGYVLKAPPVAEAEVIIQGLDEADRSLPLLLSDGLQKASTRLHTATPRP